MIIYSPHTHTTMKLQAFSLITPTQVALGSDTYWQAPGRDHRDHDHKRPRQGAQLHAADQTKPHQNRTVSHLQFPPRSAAGASTQALPTKPQGCRNSSSVPWWHPAPVLVLLLFQLRTMSCGAGKGKKGASAWDSSGTMFSGRAGSLHRTELEFTSKRTWGPASKPVLKAA